MRVGVNLCLDVFLFVMMGKQMLMMLWYQAADKADMQVFKDSIEESPPI